MTDQETLNKILKESRVDCPFTKGRGDGALSLEDNKHLFVRKDGELTYYYKGVKQ